MAKIHNLRVRKTAQVPVDTGKDRTLSNFGRGATVIASYYGKEFAGRRTASGEKFNPSKMTAAHRTLPLGTQVQVTHVRNGRSVMVRINDRGPFIKGRSIDLSAGAAAVIELGGVGRVHLKIVR
ncbi:septal ring lytic transglycosylase RlpA family protein [Methyloceanibacter sp.]|uniref:septal ring lytic transglycosylase RlpA family protein n=1 Tax=Methyloceanibacter sp. TaxID=1965321 RepID=UPI00351B349C